MNEMPMQSPVFRIGSALPLVLILAGLMALAGCAGHQYGAAPGEGPEPRWGPHEGLSSTGKYRDVAVADLDNDGHPDAVGASAVPGTVTVWYGSPGGRFGKPLFLPIKADVRSIAIGDVNEDGLKDIVCSVQRESSGIMVWHNQADRRWTQGTGPVDINNYQRVLLGDINRDGHLDIAAANMSSENQGGIQVWFGDGKGQWRNDVGPTVTGIYMDIELADLNGDGNLDLATAGWGVFGGLRYWFGDGAGGWSFGAEICKGSFYGVSLADVNGDGALDMIGAAYRGGVHLFINDGQGRFAAAPVVLEAFGKASDGDARARDPEGDKAPPGSYWKALPVDLDGDGTLDLAAGRPDGQGLAAWQNRPAGKWQALEGRFAGQGTFYGLCAVDLDGDDRPEVLSASFGEGIKVWPGNPEREASPASAGDLRQTPARPGIDRGLGIAPAENEVFRTIDGVPEYRIGFQDVLEITFWRAAEVKIEKVVVRPDGKISFGLIDDLPVAGLTASQLDALLTEKMGAFFRDPRIEVAVVEYRSHNVILAGALTRLGQGGSGQIALSGRVRLSEMLSIAGGPSANANLSEISLRRKSGQNFRLNLFDAIAKGDTSQDPVLDDGDVIFVPTATAEAKRVYVFGEVKNPGSVEFQGSQIKLFDAVTRAGGLTIYATEAYTRVVRGDPARPEVIATDLERLIALGDQTQNMDLVSGDLVYVPRGFIGDVALFVQKIEPLMRAVLLPGRLIRDVDDINDILNDKNN